MCVLHQKKAVGSENAIVLSFCPSKVTFLGTNEIFSFLLTDHLSIKTIWNHITERVLFTTHVEFHIRHNTTQSTAEYDLANFLNHSFHCIALDVSIGSLNNKNQRQTEYGESFFSMFS